MIVPALFMRLFVCCVSLCDADFVCALAVSSWLHSSGLAKASGFFYFLQNGIIWLLFLLPGSRLQGPVIHSSMPGPH